MSNYRPISLISNIAKIFEKIIYNRLYDFISKNNIISSQQFGFMKNRGISDALNFFCNWVYNNLDKSKPVIAPFWIWPRPLIPSTMRFCWQNYIGTE